VQTDGTITNNKPQNIIRINEKGTSVLINVAISRDINAIEKEVKKIERYKNVTLEVPRMRNLKRK
jgi:hypothetical protein